MALKKKNSGFLGVFVFFFFFILCPKTANAKGEMQQGTKLLVNSFYKLIMIF